VSQQLVEVRTTELDRRPLKAPYRPLGCELVLLGRPHHRSPLAPRSSSRSTSKANCSIAPRLPSDKALDAFNHPFLYGLQP